MPKRKKVKLWYLGKNEESREREQLLERESRNKLVVTFYFSSFRSQHQANTILSAIAKTSAGIFQHLLKYYPGFPLGINLKNYHKHNETNDPDQKAEDRPKSEKPKARI